jgi:hypothetical protein
MTGELAFVMRKSDARFIQKESGAFLSTKISIQVIRFSDHPLCSRV